MIKTWALVLLAIVAGVYTYQYGRSIDKTFPVRTFTVDGSGDVDTTPDIATFTASVVSEGGKNVADLQNMNTEKMNKINVYLKEQGVENKDLKTTQYNVAPKYNYSPCVAGSCPAPNIIGYTITQTLQIKVRDTGKLGDLLTGVVSNGANTVSEVSFKLDDETAAQNDARTEAIGKAKIKAQEIATAGGFQLGSLISLYENTDPAPYAAYGMGGSVDASSAKTATVPPVIEPGTQTTKIQVTLTYEILN